MKRTWVSAVVGVTLVGAAIAGTTSANAVTHHPVHKVKVWRSDQLPTDLYLWADCNDGPCHPLQHVRRYDGHRDCWLAVGDTSLVMCTDGYRTTT